MTQYQYLSFPNILTCLLERASRVTDISGCLILAVRLEEAIPTIFTPSPTPHLQSLQGEVSVSHVPRDP